MGAMNRILDGVKIGRIHSKPQGVTDRQCGLFPDYFGQLFYFRSKAKISSAFGRKNETDLQKVSKFSRLFSTSKPVQILATQNVIVSHYSARS